MSRRLFGWFAPKRGEDVLVMVEKHLELTKNAVISLHKMVENAAECNLDQCKTDFLDLSRMEMEADELRRRMVEELTKGEMFPEERDDLMELVRAVDWIADWSKEAGRILNSIPFEKSPDEIKTETLNMVKANVDCVEVLAKAIRSLPKDPMKALSLADEVEMLEETVDDLYGEVRSHFATLEFPEFSTGSLILLNEFFDAIETVADWCENTADIVRAIAVRRH
jgi:predicted phosphate transport protein (TIGR00153 family)